MDNLPQLLTSLFEEEALIQMVFGAPRKKSALRRKAVLRPVVLRGSLHYQVEYHYEKKATHENLSGEEAVALCLRLLNEEFKQLNIFSRDADYQVLAARPERPRIIKQKPTRAPGAMSHNQEKRYIIPDGRPCDFLIHLGVMTKDGQVIKKHYHKFRQINRFLEIVADVLDDLPAPKARNTAEDFPAPEARNAAEDPACPEDPTGPAEPLKIIDFGCGKAYLTFALYYYLKILQGREVEIVGLDLKEDVIAFCSETASALGYRGLRFQRGDIAEYDGASRADMVVTLHACDTATDFALIKAVGWNASIILSVPCCQHELFNQIENETNAAILKQGILKERFSAILTDALRALKLEEHGYEVTMLEFTSLEHTAKNIMLRCVRRPGTEDLRAAKAKAPEKTDPAAASENKGPTAASGSTAAITAKEKAHREHARREYEKLKEFWNVSPSIDGMD